MGGHLTGEKNGEMSGMKLSIAVISVGEIKGKERNELDTIIYFLALQAQYINKG